MISNSQEQINIAEKALRKIEVEQIAPLIEVIEYHNKNLRQEIASNLGMHENHKRLMIGHWKCEESPSGTCVYDYIQDPLNDECLICGEPEERK